MNVLSQAPASSAVSTVAAAAANAEPVAATPAATAPSGQVFAQVWGQQMVQAAASAGGAQGAAVQAPELHTPGAEAQTSAVVLGDVLPVLHLPVQQAQLIEAQQRAAHAALGLSEGETLETEAAQDSLLPAMQTLSALPVVHPQLRREAVSSVEASSAQASTPVIAHVTDAVVRSSAAVAPVADALIATPAAGGVTPAPALGAAKTSSASALVQALGQRIQLQQVQGQDVVTVRLDPPQWGRVEIRIQQDASGVQVLLQASHAEVGRQLTTVVDSLRQELQARTGGEASVVVASSQRSMAGQGQGGGGHAQQDDAAHRGDEPVGQALQFDMGDGAV